MRKTEHEREPHACTPQRQTEEEVDKIALIAPDATVNIISNYEVKKKIKVTIPKIINKITELKVMVSLDVVGKLNDNQLRDLEN